MKKLALVLSLCLASSTAFAINDIAKPLQSEWEISKYQTAAKEREAAFEKLAHKAEQVAQQHPNDADVLIWQAIILSSYAGEKGGLGALSLVKQAKAILEKTAQHNPNALDGSAFTTLGSLYYQVPGWPIGFGDKEQAEVFLKKALSINPDGIDANYFYGDFLAEQKRYPQAIAALEKALKAAPRPGRELADQGRREEIKTLLEKIRHKVGK